MSAVLQMDFPSLISNTTKFVQFKTDFCTAIMNALSYNKGCTVTGVASSSVVGA